MARTKSTSPPAVGPKQSPKNPEALFRNFRDKGIFFEDLQGKTTFINNAAAKMLNYNVDELVGRPMHAFVHHSKPDGSLNPKEDCPIDQALRGVFTYQTEDIFWKKDGSPLHVEYSVAPILAEDKVTGAAIIFKIIHENPPLAKRNFP